jgi:hypothetical protein
MLDPLTAGTWIASVGWLLLSQRQLVSRFLVVFGIGLMALSVMTLLGIHSLSAVLADMVVVGLFWLGWVLIGREGRGERRAATIP